jgi:hypothetical protein
MSDEYGTSLDDLKVMQEPEQPPVEQQPQYTQQVPQQIPQQISQQVPQYNQPAPQYSPQIPQYVPQPVGYNQMMQQPVNNTNFMSKLDVWDSTQSVVIIVILFVLFGSCYFKEICKNLPFMCIVDNEYNLPSLLIVALLSAVSYVIIKTYFLN